jgi:hypothetical protein
LTVTTGLVAMLAAAEPFCIDWVVKVVDPAALGAVTFDTLVPEP